MPTPYDQMMKARAEAEAQVLQKPPMFLSQAGKIRAGLWYPAPLHRLQADVDRLRGDVQHAEECGRLSGRARLLVILLDLASAITAILSEWREGEIKRWRRGNE